MPFSGTTDRTFTGSRKMSGTFSMSGTAVGGLKLYKTVTGVLAFTSSLLRTVVYKRKSDGSLAKNGTVNRVFTGSRAISLSLIHISEPTRPY